MVSFKSLLPLITLASAANMLAVGIPVNDLQASQDFYTKVLGFAYTGLALEFDGLSERVLKMPGKNSGSALILMKHNTTRPTTVGKIVLEVEDVKKTVEAVRAYGKGTNIKVEPGTYKKKDGANLPTAFVTDVDGWDVELNPMGLYG
jgi:catechol 2,3-dioxygenase-like lactoylglutathione lyase family enzyme